VAGVVAQGIQIVTDQATQTGMTIGVNVFEGSTILMTTIYRIIIAEMDLFLIKT
jgi:hypothetical protein